MFDMLGHLFGMLGICLDCWFVWHGLQKNMFNTHDS